MLCRMATTASSFATSGFTPGATGQAQSIAAGAQAAVRGRLTAVHFRDKHGFAIFSVEQPDGLRRQTSCVAASPELAYEPRPVAEAGSFDGMFVVAFCHENYHRFRRADCGAQAPAR